MPILSPSYHDAIRTALRDGAYAEMIHLIALSAALNLPIQSFCLSGTHAIDNLHPYTLYTDGRVCESRFVPDALMIMWTYCEMPLNVEDLDPNHFILLVPRRWSTALPADAVDIPRASTPIAVSLNHGRDDLNTSPIQSHPVNNDINFSEISVGDEDTDRPSCHQSKDLIQETFDDNFVLIESSKSSSSNTANNDDVEPDDTSSSSVGVTSVNCTDANCDTSDDVQVKSDLQHSVVPRGMKALPNGKRLDTEELLRILLLTSSPLPQRIPNGRKENVFVVLDNIANVRRARKGKRRSYDDDCGAWSSKGQTMPKVPHVMLPTGDIKRVLKKMADTAMNATRHAGSIHTSQSTRSWKF
jgi:hypothetical protein